MESLSDTERELAFTHVTNELALLQDMPWPVQPSEIVRSFVVDVLRGLPIRGMGQAFVDCTVESFCRFCDAYTLFQLDLARAEIAYPGLARSTLWILLRDDLKALYFRAVASERSVVRPLADTLPSQLPPSFFKAFIDEATRVSGPPTSTAVAPAASTQSNNLSTSSVHTSTAGSSSGINVASAISQGRTAAVITYSLDRQWSKFLRGIAYPAAT